VEEKGGESEITSRKTVTLSKLSGNVKKADACSKDKARKKLTEEQIFIK